jgi:hypothetical protein
MGHMVLPNFIIPGTEKGGTTPLFRLLIQHPDIHMPKQKELAFFSRMYDRREPTFYEWQISRDYRGQRAVGEATPEYMRFPQVARRIHAMLGPDVRFIFCLRNPVTRAYSHYLQCVRMLEEGQSFERALELDAHRRQRGRFLNQRRTYVQGGFYAEQIERYLSLYPRDRLHFVILEEDIQGRQRQRARALGGTLEFLGVDPGFEFDFDIKDTRLPPPDIRFVRKGEAVRIPGKRRRAVAGSIVVNAHVAGAHRYIPSPSAMARRFYTQLERNMTRALAPETAAMLYERHFREQIDRAETLIGRDLSVWRPR